MNLVRDVGMKKLGKDFLERFRALPTGSISDAFDRLGIRGVITCLRPVFEGTRVAGPAVTLRQVTSTSPETAPRHSEVLDKVAQAGDVMVIDCDGRVDVATWGGLLSTRAKSKGLEGVVIDGATRDVDDIRSMRYPVFVRGFSPATSRTRFETVSIQSEVQCGGVKVRPGDLIVGDDTGIIVIPQERVEEVLYVSEGIVAHEKEVLERLRKGISYFESRRS